MTNSSRSSSFSLAGVRGSRGICLRVVPISTYPTEETFVLGHADFAGPIRQHEPLYVNHTTSENDIPLEYLDNEVGIGDLPEL